MKSSQILRPLLALAFGIFLAFLLQRFGAASVKDSAREMCSCIFVLDESEAFCAEISGLSQEQYSLNLSARSVSVASRTSAYGGSRFGCVESSEP